MSVRIPQNQISPNKYTTGKEFVYEKTYKEYQGFYYEVNGKIFAGNEFSVNAPSLLRMGSDKINILKDNPETLAYANASNSILYKQKDLVSIPLDAFESGTKYLAQVLNSYPIRIIFISKEDYNNNLKNPLYSLTSLYYHAEWGFNIEEQNKKDIPEIDIFLADFITVDN
jgi:hypothetical protein